MKRNKKPKRPVEFRRVVSIVVLATMLAATVYISVMLIVASTTEATLARSQSDYVLMLLQCLLGIAGVCLPAMLEKRHNLVIPSNMMILYVLFLYGAIFLGEVMAFYYRVPHWDTFLHTLSGAMLGALGYSVITFLNKSDGVPVNLSPLFVAFFAFCFSVAMGMVWEIYEYTVDVLFHTNMQKYAVEGGAALMGQQALADTMKDIIVDAIGALVIAVIGYISLKRDKIFVNKLLFKRRKKDGGTKS